MRLLYLIVRSKIHPALQHLKSLGKHHLNQWDTLGERHLLAMSNDQMSNEVADPDQPLEIHKLHQLDQSIVAHLTNQNSTSQIQVQTFVYRCFYSNLHVKVVHPQSLILQSN